MREDPRATRASVALICGLLVLSGCGLSGGANSTPTASPTTAAALTCTVSYSPIDPDTLSGTLTCQVAGAASDQTSFTLTYTAPSPKGQGVDATCGGALHSGTGTCTVSFTASAQASRPGTVTGQLLPSDQHLGPETPTVAPASP